MKNLLYLSYILFIFLGCMSKKKLGIVQNKIPDLQIHGGIRDSSLKTRYLYKIDTSNFKFQTFSAKGQVNFNRNGDTHTADINIRIKKDEIIWFYINLSIIPVAQGYITPNEIRFKNLINGEYTHKNFQFLQELAGVPLSFQDIQSILLGNALTSFLGDSSRLTINPGGDFVVEGKKSIIQNRFSFNPQYRPFIIDLQDSIHNRKVNLKYGNFLAQNGTFIPLSIQILAQAKDNTLEIQMDYRRIQFNPEQDYPFHSPDGSN